MKTYFLLLLLFAIPAQKSLAGDKEDTRPGVMRHRSLKASDRERKTRPSASAQIQERQAKAREAILDRRRFGDFEDSELKKAFHNGLKAPMTRTPSCSPVTEERPACTPREDSPWGDSGDAMDVNN